MLIQLCKKSILQKGGDLHALVDKLRDDEHSPIVKDCLDRCQRCDLGFIVASADGMPLSAPTIDQFFKDVEELAAEE